MKSFDAWINAFMPDNNLEYSGHIDDMEDAWNAGAASKQAEIDTLNKDNQQLVTNLYLVNSHNKEQSEEIRELKARIEELEDIEDYKDRIKHYMKFKKKLI